MSAIFLTDCERVLLREIADPQMKRRDVAITYRLSMAAWARNDEEIDWRKVNEAIIARWSRSALEWIKREAHKP